jgi:hypothetical protein
VGKLELKGTETRLSGRCRKLPITRNDYFFVVNRSIKENGLIIIDMKAYYPQQTSYNKAIRVTIGSKESNLTVKQFKHMGP